MTDIRDIRTIETAALSDEIVSWGEKAFRAKQIQEWLWSKKAKRFEEMSNLSIELRNKLEENFKRIELI